MTYNVGNPASGLRQAQKCVKRLLDVEVTISVLMVE